MGFKVQRLLPCGLGSQTAHGAVEQHQIRCLGGPAAHLGVGGGGVVAKLEHIAQNRNAPARRPSGPQNCKRRGNRLGPCVITVGDERIAAHLQHVLPVAGVAEEGQGLCNPLGADAQAQADQSGGERVIDVMAALHRQVDGDALAKALGNKAGEALSKLDLHGAQVTFGVDAEEKRLDRQLGRAQKRLVAV